MFHVKHPYRFSPDYLSETWPLLAFASGPGREPRRAGRDRPAGSADPIGRGPRRLIRGARIPALDARPSIPAPDFVQQRKPPGPKRQKNLGKTGGFPPIRDFLLKIRSRLGDRILRFFGNFWQKPQKRAKKTGSLVELVGTGRGRGRRTGRGSRCLHPDLTNTGIEGRGSRTGFRPLLTRFRRTKGRLSSISCPVAVS